MFEKVGITRISITLIFLAALVAYSSAQQNEIASSEYQICHENLYKCLAVCVTATNRTICENECPTCSIRSSTSGGKFGLGYDQNGPCCIIVNATEDCHSRQLSPASCCHRKRYRDCGKFCMEGMMFAERITKCSEPTENKVFSCYQTISYVAYSTPTHRRNRRPLFRHYSKPISLASGFGNDVVFAVSGNNVVSGPVTNSGADNNPKPISITSSIGNDVVVAVSGNNVASGPVNDVTDSGAGNKFSVSGSGNKIVVPGNGNDFVVSGTGNNLQVDGSGNFIKVSSFDSHIVVFGAGNDINVSGSGHNVVVHGAGQHVVVDGIGKHVEAN